jgi:hypothetical protein
MGSKKLFEINLLDQSIVYEQIYQNDSEGFIIWILLDSITMQDDLFSNQNIDYNYFMKEKLLLTKNLFLQKRCSILSE